MQINILGVITMGYIIPVQSYQSQQYANRMVAQPYNYFSVKRIYSVQRPVHLEKEMDEEMLHQQHLSINRYTNESIQHSTYSGEKYFACDPEKYWKRNLYQHIYIGNFWRSQKYLIYEGSQYKEMLIFLHKKTALWTNLVQRLFFYIQTSAPCALI